jgi:hypothetical protein
VREGAREELRALRGLRGPFRGPDEGGVKAVGERRQLVVRSGLADATLLPKGDQGCTGQTGIKVPSSPPPY